jgi:hypothetical protein
MAYPQSSIEEIVDSERAMIRDGEARYGRHYKLAQTSTMYLTLCIESIDADRSDTFGRLISLIKTHLMLAFLSALRLHHVQAMMNLRQVFEAGAAAAYSIANPTVDDFVDIDEFGLMDPTKELTSKRYKWLDENYAAASSWIKDQKKLINEQSAHANIISGNRGFRVVAEGKGVSTPFFDIEDEAFVKIDLWRVGSAAIGLMQLFYLVTGDVGRTSGRFVLGFRSDFERAWRSLAVESNALLDEQRDSDRFKAAMFKAEQRAKAKGKPE